jgi:hypothetical protein
MIMEAGAYGMPRSGWFPAVQHASDHGQTCAVSLVDRRTGAKHRINGRPLTLLTRNPQDAIAELLEGRDATVWEARVDVIGQAGERA